MFNQPDFAGSILRRFGVPFAYERSTRQAVRLLCGANVDVFSDEELLGFFKGGLLLDTAAAEKLQARVFAPFMGCTVEQDDLSFYTREVVALPVREKAAALRMGEATAFEDR